MRISLITKFLTVAAVGLLLYSCVEEPTIDPVKYPYSSLRVGNFTVNEDVINLSIDDKAIGSIQKGTVLNYTGPGDAGYFDLTSGSRSFKLTDAAGNLIFNKKLDVSSYAEFSIGFAGYYSTDELNNSFGQEQFQEGVVYLNDNTPSADSAIVYLVNLLSFAPTSPDSLIKFDIALFHPDPQSAEDSLVALSEVDVFGESAYQIPSGNYRILTAASKDADNFRDSTDFTVKSGMRYYVWMYGEAADMKFNVEELSPLPVREK